MALAVMVMVRSVRPWNAWSNTTTACRPVAYRAIFTAFSTASAPVETNSVFFGNDPGVSSFRRSASSTYGSYWATCMHR